MDLEPNGTPTDAPKLLEKAEEKIEKSVKNAFYVVGLELRHIRSQRLYLDSYNSFEQYSKERWEWSETYVTRLIKSADVYDAINDALPIGKASQLPKKESHVRPLLKLDNPEQRVEAWKSAVENAANKDKCLTARNVSAEVRRISEENDEKDSTKKCFVVAKKRKTNQSPINVAYIDLSRDGIGQFSRGDMDVFYLAVPSEKLLEAVNVIGKLELDLIDIGLVLLGQDKEGDAPKFTLVIRAAKSGISLPEPRYKKGFGQEFILGQIDKLHPKDNKYLHPSVPEYSSWNHWSLPKASQEAQEYPEAGDDENEAVEYPIIDDKCAQDDTPSDSQENKTEEDGEEELPSESESKVDEKGALKETQNNGEEENPDSDGDKEQTDGDDDDNRPLESETPINTESPHKLDLSTLAKVDRNSLEDAHKHLDHHRYPPAIKARIEAVLQDVQFLAFHKDIAGSSKNRTGLQLRKPPVVVAQAITWLKARKKAMHFWKSGKIENKEPQIAALFERLMNLDVGVQNAPRKDSLPKALSWRARYDECLYVWECWKKGEDVADDFVDNGVPQSWVETGKCLEWAGDDES